MGLLNGLWNRIRGQKPKVPVDAKAAGKVDRTPEPLNVVSEEYTGFPRTLAYRGKLWTEIPSKRDGLAVFSREIATPEGKASTNTVTVNNADLTQRADGCWILFDRKG